MSEASLHCVHAIAAVNCTLQATIGRFERCSGASCPFWDDYDCLFHRVKPELLRRPGVAEHLLELRDSLAAARNGDIAAQARTQFHRLLNEEQESERSDVGP